MNYRIFAKDKLRSAGIQVSLMFSAILHCINPKQK